jgi:tetratricopeptide (TPR) repeat protein
MKRTGFILGLSLIVSVTMFGQKKAVTDALKYAKLVPPNFKEARAKISGALENAETKDDAKTWFTAGQIENLEVEAENQKQINGTAPNLDVLYSAVYGIYPYFAKAYELDKLPDAKGKVKPKYVKEMKTILKERLPYYINAGAHFFEKKEYKKAYDVFNQYVDIKDGTLIHEGDKEKDKLLESITIDSNYIWAIYYSAVAASMVGDAELSTSAMKRCVQKVEYNRNEMYQYLVQEYVNISDTANIELTCEEAHALFPKESFYVLHLINIYIKTERHDKALAFIDVALQNDPNDVQLYDVAGRIYETNKKDVAKAQEYFMKEVELDPDNPEAQSNVGRIYFNQGVAQLDVANNENDVKKYQEQKEIAKELFKKALPYFEKSFKLNPNVGETKFVLKNIYYNLDMGDKYEEMDKLIEGN